MVITSTAVAFSLSAIGLAFCGFRFFEAFQKIGGLRSGSRIGILLSLLFFGTSFQHGILALSSLFFAGIPEAFYAVLVIDILVLALITTLSVYLAIYILLPIFSPLPPTIITFLFGIFVTTLTLIAHPLPFVNANWSIDLNMPHWLEIPLYYLLLLLQQELIQ